MPRLTEGEVSDLPMKSQDDRYRDEHDAQAKRYPNRRETKEWSCLAGLTSLAPRETSGDKSTCRREELLHHD